MNKKSQGWLKFIRLLIYVISIIGITVGASLIKTGSLSASYADGTFVAKIHNGEVIFFTSLIILSANIMWGILRWFLRGYREKWRAGRIIGKLIGGGIWRTLVIIPLIIISIILITPAICNLIEENVLSEQISFEPYDPDYLEHRLEYLEAHISELSPEDIYEELMELSFQNIQFGTDDDARENNITTASSGLFTSNAYAYTPSVVFLNKAKLSDNKKFVVFYTSYGDDAITDAKAKEICDMLDEIINGYKNNLGFDFDYYPYKNFKTIDFRRKAQDVVDLEMAAVLINSGIEADVLKTAMPVYIANPYRREVNTLATYAGTEWIDALHKTLEFASELPGIGIALSGFNLENTDTLRFYDTAPTFPLINIPPKIVDKKSLRIVLAHELGHHYAGLYSDANNREQSRKNFVKETAANWMAINTSPLELPMTLINDNHYNGLYLNSGTSLSPDQIIPGCDEDGEDGSNTACDGYPFVSFLQNYYETVDDGKAKIMNALASDTALMYLYNEAGPEQFTKVMVSLAEKNLTGDYGGKLTNMTIPKGETLGCTDVCTTSYPINPAATNYLYFATTEYNGTNVKFIGSDAIRVSILGQSLDGRFEIISSNNMEKDFKISDEGRFAEYQMIAFAVANASASDVGTYVIEIEAEELEDLIDDTSKKPADNNTDRVLDFTDLYKVTEPGCYELNTDKIFDNLWGLIGIGSDFINALSEFDKGSDYSEIKTSYEESSTEAAANINEAKNQLSPYRITVCFDNLKKGIGLKDAKSRAFFKRKLNFLNAEIDSVKISGYAGVDLLTRIGKIYLLTEQKNNTTMLVTITVAKR